MPKSQGLVGIDVAYSLAIFGTVFFNVFYVAGEMQHYLNHSDFFLFFDFFPAFFFFLTGLTFSLSVRERRVSTRRMLSNSTKKGLLLVIVGLLFIGIWATNLFVPAGLFFIVAPYVVGWNSFFLRLLAIISFVLSASLIYLDVPTHPEYSSLQLQGAGIRELLGYLLFNGYYSFLPWFCFFLAGIIYSRTDIRPKGWFPPSSLVGLALLITGLLAQIYSEQITVRIPAREMGKFFFFTVKAFMPSFILTEIGFSVILLNALKYFFRRAGDKKMIGFFRTVSSSKYSIYLYMLFLGSLAIGIFNLTLFKSRLLLFMLDGAICGLCLYFAISWKRRFTAKPPAEWMIERVSSATKS